MTSPVLEAAYRNDFERKVAAQLREGGVDPDRIYETVKVPYTVPLRKAFYKPDFPKGNIIIEAKGKFTDHETRCMRCGHRFPIGDGASARQKMALVKEQHPELDIRLVFQRATTPIYKGSKTTYAKWSDDHSFKWSDKGIVPDDWIKEMKQ